jgi:hypothetical protein
VRASQKYQVARIKIPQFDHWVSPCSSLFLVFLQVCHDFESIRFQQAFFFGFAWAHWVTVAVLKLWCFTSSGRIAYAPYISQNRVKFVALHTVVLLLHTAFGITSTHLPFFSRLSYTGHSRAFVLHQNF